MKKFTKDITSVLAALTAGAVAAVPGSIILQGSSANAETDSTSEITTSVSKVMAVPGTGTIDDNTIEEQGPFTEGSWDIVGDMAPVDECTGTECIDPENTPTAGVPLISDELIPDVTTVTELPPVGGVPLVSDELIPDVPAVTEMPPLAGEPLVSDELIPDEPDVTEMPPVDGGMMADDRFIPDEKGRKLSMIKIRINGITFKEFALGKYYNTLVSEEGMSEAEAAEKSWKLYDSYCSRGRITNAEIERAYKSFLAVEASDAAEAAMKAIAGDNDRDLRLVYDYPEVYSLKIEVRLSDAEFKRAERADGVMCVQNTDEITRFDGKLDDRDIVSAVRRGDKTIPVSVNIKHSFGDMSEADAITFFRELSGVSGPVTVEMEAGTACFSAEIPTGQIEKLAYSDVVESIGYSYMAALSGAVPTVIPEGKTVAGDINSDGITDVTDLSMLSLYLIGDRDLSEAQKKAADVDGDGSAEIPDLAKMKQFLSKIIEKL